MVTVHTCDACGKELCTSRDTHFGDDRLVVEGEPVAWFRVSEMAYVKQDYATQDETKEFCSRECLIRWASHPVAL